MTFWIISGALALMTALGIGWVLLRPRAEDDGAAESVDIRVYRDQLQAVDRDLARGVVTEQEAERLRTEIKRRILDADNARSGAAAQAPRTLSFAAAAIAGLAVIGGTFLIYGRVGAPGYADQPLKKRLAEAEKIRTERPSQQEYEARMPPSPHADAGGDYLNLVKQLRDAVKNRPEDLEGWVLLARNEAQLGNLPDAHAAQRKVIEIKGDAATAEDHVTYAAMLIQAAGGNVSAEADRALNGALGLDPKNQLARYFAGLMHLQTRRPDQTFQFWEPLLSESPIDAPWVPVIRARLAAVAAMAGIQYELPQDPHFGTVAAAGGPTAEDMDAAADMAPEERQAFIQNMVDQLGRRMAEQGGPPSDWAELIRAHGVLGSTDRAAAIWAEAQQTFSDPADLAPIRMAAQQAGVASGGAEDRGPTQADVDAAAEMSDEDRDAMVQNMVDQLGERLATEGGPPADWAKLIRAHGVLGNTDQAAAIWAEAQQKFGQSPEHLEPVRQAAISAGVAE